MKHSSGKCNRHLVPAATTMLFHKAEDPKDFHWSFSPILRWLRLIGVDMNSNDLPSIRQRIYQYSLFACHVCIHVFFFIHLWNSEKRESVWIIGTQNTLTFSWTFTVHMINMSVNAVATHFLLLFHVTKKWNYLLHSFEALKNHVDPNLKVKLHRASATTVVYVIVTVQYRIS